MALCIILFYFTLLVDCTLLASWTPLPQGSVLFFALLSLVLCLHFVGTSMRWLHSADCAMNNEIASAASLEVNCIPKRDTCLCDGC